MLVALWLLQAAPLPSYPALHLTQPKEWVDAGHVAPYTAAIVARARAELSTEPPPEPIAATPRDIGIWRPAGTALALDGMTRSLLSGSRAIVRSHERIPPVVRIWPLLPTPRADALLPGRRIIAFYGNQKSTRMGILGEFPPEEMMQR